MPKNDDEEEEDFPFSHIGWLSANLCLFPRHTPGIFLAQDISVYSVIEAAAADFGAPAEAGSPLTGLGKPASAQQQQLLGPPSSMELYDHGRRRATTKMMFKPLTFKRKKKRMRKEEIFGGPTHGKKA